MTTRISAKRETSRSLAKVSSLLLIDHNVFVLGLNRKKNEEIEEEPRLHHKESEISNN